MQVRRLVAELIRYSDEIVRSPPPMMGKEELEMFAKVSAQLKSYNGTYSEEEKKHISVWFAHVVERKISTTPRVIGPSDDMARKVWTARWIVDCFVKKIY